MEESIEEKPNDLSVSGDSIRRRFLDFYASRGHKVLPSASLVPDDPTVLLTIAGMLQFKPIFLGKARQAYLVEMSKCGLNRLNQQFCIFSYSEDIIA